MGEQCEVSPSKLNGKFSAMGVLRQNELNSRNYEDGCLTYILYVLRHRCLFGTFNRRSQTFVGGGD